MRKVQQSPDPATARSAIVVAGMHRSGTSAMARVLGLAGASLPERLIQPGDDNPKGFWEPQDVVALNDEILRTLGSAWNDVFGFRVAGLARDQHDGFVARARSVLALNFAGKGPVVMKDPRVSLLAPVWREALAAEGLRPVFVIMVRHPLEVARSIAARDGSPVQAATLAWLSHVVAVERDTRDLPRIFVRYSDLLEDWRPVLDRIGQQLGLDLDPAAGPGIDAYLTRSERHHSTDDQDPLNHGELWPGVGEAWRWLVGAARPDGPASAFPSAIERELTVLHARIGPLLDLQRQDAERRQAELQRALADCEARLLRRGAQTTEYQNVQLRLEADLMTARADVTTLKQQLETEALSHAEAVRTLDEAVQQLVAANASAGAEARQQQRDTEARVAEAHATIQSLTAHLEAMRLSPSWRLTRPLRVVRKRFAALSEPR